MHCYRYTVVKAITSLPCLHSAASRHCLVEEDEVGKSGVVLSVELVVVWCVTGEERQGGSFMMEGKKPELFCSSSAGLFCFAVISVCEEMPVLIYHQGQ